MDNYQNEIETMASIQEVERSSINYISFTGTITEVRRFYNEQGEVEAGHYFILVENGSGETVTFAITPSTYIMDCNIKRGDYVTGYYDGDAPVPLIYPPQYNTLVLAKNKKERNVKVSHFDENLVSLDNTLQIMIKESAWIATKDGVPFCRDLRNRNLAVLYGVSTRSIPALTSPYVIIVLED